MPALRLDHMPERVRLFRDGLAGPLLVQHAAKDRRPYIHPILAPDGHGTLTENQPGHHLWQHGLYVGLNDVNGAGFWTEGLHPKNKATDGSFHPQPLKAPQLDASSGGAAWSVVSEWRMPDGSPLLTETQAWSFADRGEHFLLDLDWTLRGAREVTFGQYAYGGLFLRMPYKGVGTAFNSEGQANKDAEARRAKWVCVSLPIEGRESCREMECGIAILDDPRNPEHPVPWRVDNQLGIAPSRCIAGAWKLAQGETTTNRYRLYIFTGPAQPAAIETQWRNFVAAPRP